MSPSIKITKKGATKGSPVILIRKKPTYKAVPAKPGDKNTGFLVRRKRSKKSKKIKSK